MKSNNWPVRVFLCGKELTPVFEKEFQNTNGLESAFSEPADRTDDIKKELIAHTAKDSK